MPKKFADNIIVIVATAAIVIIAGALMLDHAARQQTAALEPLREQNEALRTQADENRREIEATSQLLRQAIARSDAGVFRSDEEVQHLNQDRIDQLADAIARRVTPSLPAPKSTEELAREESEEIDRIASSTADKLQPAIADMQGERRDAAAQAARDARRIDALRGRLQATQVAAQQALDLTRQVSSLYLNSFHDQGVLVRLVELPGDLFHDAAGGNVFYSRDQEKAQKTIDAKLDEVERQLEQVQTQAQQGGGSPLARN